MVVSISYYEQKITLDFRYIPGDAEAMDTFPAINHTVKNEYFPKSGYIKFESANIDAIIGLFGEVNFFIFLPLVTSSS